MYGGTQTLKTEDFGIEAGAKKNVSQMSRGNLDDNPGYVSFDPELQKDKFQQRKYYKNSERLNDHNLERIIN